MADRVHHIKKTVRLTEGEADLLLTKAKDASMNEAEYIRFLISQKPNDYPEIRKLLKQLINEVNRIGVNVNQIAKSSNAGICNAGDKDRLFAYMIKISKSLDEAVKKIGYQ